MASPRWSAEQMSTQRPLWWPLYGDPVRCPIRSDKEQPCLRFECVMNPGFCQERNALALVPKEETETLKGKKE